MARSLLLPLQILLLSLALETAGEEVSTPCTWAVIRWATGELRGSRPRSHSATPATPHRPMLMTSCS
ncbi:KLK7 isoform 1 [Pan troglodytes]|uniref:Kallikrein 7 splice variant 3 n=2 Tax=Homininae TaxID=207598 RepID=Q6DTY1_HUMAN|nr:kallikrein 7 splice variant 3 precursor [Homo sapiens]KAI2592605.1 kallikrein related peptidase 7 [Homo sapiens]KAI4044258.1 kallikrein related peptidase 7 [Homo sapiens]PNI91887.1 KLK7 isoform 1 [Pan troglodytes]